MPPPDGLSGGAALEAYLNRLAENLAKASEVRVGILEASTYPDGESVAVVAAVQEFGSPDQNIPPRPFFRSMIAKHENEWGDQVGKLLAAHDYDAAKTLALMGELIAGELRQSIVDLVDPPLAPATIARKGSDKPLVDSGVMLQSVDYEVTEG